MPTREPFCLEVSTGKQQWSKPGYFSTTAGKLHDGFIGMGNRILVLTDRGELLLINSNPEAFKEISRVQVCGMNWCIPA